MRVLHSLCFLIASALFTCCQQQGKPKIVKIKTNVPQITQSAIPPSSKVSEEYEGGIQELPFGKEVKLKGFLKSESYFLSLIYSKVEQPPSVNLRWQAMSNRKREDYPLPTIRSLTYTSFTSALADTCLNTKPFASYLRLNKYRYRLPDIYGFECYYWADYQVLADYQAVNNSNSANDLISTCWNCLPTEYHGYLILYNRRTAHAHVLLIYYDMYQDLMNYYRFFKIDKNYNIQLFDFGINEEGGTVPSDPAEIKTVYITKQGTFALRQ